jgi:tellurite resistance protein
VLDQLVGIRDEPRATEALIQAASGTQDSRNRARAAEALWHHAADLQFADEASISALEQLATDTDARVQKTAWQALEDMKQFRQRNSSP